MLSTLVSVIIPAYNSELYIERAIRSVLDQKYNNLELIIIDDASSDGTLEKCICFSNVDDRVKVVHLKKNRGVSYARNLGIDTARGEYLIFIDSDDYVSSDFISNLLKTADVDLYLSLYRKIMGNRRRKDIDLNYTGVLEVGKNSDKILELQRKLLFSGPWGKIYKSNIIHQHNIKFDLRYSYGEDTLFVIDYLMHVSKIYVSATVDYFYFQTPQSLSSQRPSFDALINWSCVMLERRMAFAALLLEDRKYIEDAHIQYSNYLATSFYALFGGKCKYTKSERLKKISLLKDKKWWHGFYVSLKIKKSTLIFYLLMNILPVGFICGIYNFIFKIVKK